MFMTTTITDGQVGHYTACNDHPLTDRHSPVLYSAYNNVVEWSVQQSEI